MIHLESMRRSSRLGVFLLLLCLMRVGMVMACAPHDVAELASGGTHSVAAAQAGDDGTSNDPSPNNDAGHCLHCACHFSAALPAAVIAMSAVSGHDMQAHSAALQASAPPARDLRPPIV